MTLSLYFLMVVVGILQCHVYSSQKTTPNPASTQKPGTLFKGHDRSLVERKLRDRLLEKYDKAIMPNMNDSALFHVTAELILTGIQEVDVKNQRIHVTAWLKMEWYDSRLVWNASQNANLLSLPFNQADIYLPEILLFNRYRARDSEIFGTSMAVAYWHGEVMWLPAGTLEVPCNMSLATWPYDTHECVFIFGHASRDNSSFEMYTDSPVVSLDSFSFTQIDWKVISTRAARFQFYNDIGDGYDNLRFYITVQREILPFLRSIFLAPHVLLLTSLSILWIADANVRVVYAAGELATSLLFAAYFWSVIPATREPPKFAYLVAGTPILIFLSLLCSFLLDLLSACCGPCPTWLKTLTNSSCKMTTPRPLSSKTDTNGSRLLTISTEQLVLTADIHDVAPLSVAEQNRIWRAFSDILRMVLFFLYSTACGLLALLTVVL
ncbi:putative Acetylcholine receptor subunit alpha-type acr-7 [Hypsibius exemplaris]|uniref:Acetylcholine receptor subunit alpha-type acr-7 n=1 Tax=Hypsibius exemplaris TaxID=2072580 RepID=A0A9X6NIK5_HYPEX|nr:putative Acetylcholine receptor subunit alpha-type acr-7 [Hypsibius exemplaris]